jgi:hypothetical protein
MARPGLNCRESGRAFGPRGQLGGSQFRKMPARSLRMCSRGPLSCLTASWVARFPDDVDVPRLVPVRRDKTPVVRVPLAGIHPSGSRVILLAPTMAGDRVEFQGGRGTLIDECPSYVHWCPLAFPSVPVRGVSGHFRACQKAPPGGVFVRAGQLCRVLHSVREPVSPCLPTYEVASRKLNALDYRPVRLKSSV